MAPPYRIGKGPIVVAMEQFLATGDVATYYGQLVDEATYLTALTPTVFDTFLATANAQGHTHLMDDVFGPGEEPELLPPEQVAAVEQRGLSRRLVYGRGVRRALEIAYGFPGAPAAEPWTIDIYWGCGQPFNLVALGTNTAKKILTMILYSDEPATAGLDTVVEQDATQPLSPDAGGDLFFVDDREGVGTVKEWRATKLIGFATSPG